MPFCLQTYVWEVNGKAKEKLNHTFNSNQQVYDNFLFTVWLYILHQVIEYELFINGFFFDKVEFILILLQMLILLFGFGKKHVPDASGVEKVNFC